MKLGLYSAAILAIFGVSVAHADPEGGTKPLFEVGAGAIIGYTPDYPAADQSHLHGLPLPYLIYRGQYLRMEGSNIRGILYESPIFKFDFSASGSFSTNSRDNRARAGMPSLDYLGEVGPRLNILLAHNDVGDKLNLELPIRAAFSTNLSSLDYRGVTFAPALSYREADFLGTHGQLKLGAGPKFATVELMDYFYEVAPQYVTASRARYTAKDGYLGSELDATYRYPLADRITLFGRFATDLYSGAANAASPLFKRDVNFSTGFGLTYSFYYSDKEVPDVPE